MKNVRWLAPLFAFTTYMGCGSSPAPSPEAASPSSAPAVAQENPSQANTPALDRDSFQGSPAQNVAVDLPVNAQSAPEAVVTAFLAALKSGDDGVTAALLTGTARQETAKHNLAVQPPGSPMAQYEVTAAEVDKQDPSLSQVACLWTEAGEQGTTRTDEVIWVLRKETQGWRVCGMATQVPTRKEPVFFNFEDPQEMMQVSEEISQEMEKVAQGTTPATTVKEEPAALQAKTPTGGNSLRK